MSGRAGRAQELNQLRRAARLDEVLQEGAVLARQLDHLLARGLGVGDGVGLDEQRPADVGLAAAQPGTVLAAQHERLGAGGKLGGITQARDRTDAAVVAFEPRHQQDQAVALAGSLDRGLRGLALDSERDGHVWEDDNVVHGHDW